MEQIAELLKAIGEFLSGLGAALAPIAAVAVALIAKSKPRKPLNRRRKRQQEPWIPDNRTIQSHGSTPNYSMEHHERQDRNHRTHVRSRQPRAGHRIPERTGRCVRNVLGRAGLSGRKGKQWRLNISASNRSQNALASPVAACSTSSSLSPTPR